MNIARTIITTLLLTVTFCVNAQESNGYYFKDFTNGQVFLRNKQFARGKFNFVYRN